MVNKLIKIIGVFLIILLNFYSLGFSQTDFFDFISKKNNYESYLSKYKEIKRPEDIIFIPAVNYKTFKDCIIEKRFDLTHDHHPVLYIGDRGYVEWEFFVKEEGFYNIALKYYPIKGKNSNIERELILDGKRPFNEARVISFERIWKNADLLLKDNRGNELRPTQIESPRWEEKLIEDSEGLYNEPFLFYLRKGKHTIRLNTIKEPIVIDYIKIFNKPEVKSYEVLKREYLEKNYPYPKGLVMKIQGERADFKSEPTLYPLSDRSNPLNDPYDFRRKILNIIGGYNWRSAGQWIEWKFMIPEDGLYKIGIKFRQNANPGIPTERTLYIDGEIPFKEAQSIKFIYDINWRFMYLGNDKEPYLFYLKKGEHTLRLKVSYGTIAEIIRNIWQCAIDLSQLYTKIVMITGPNPDPLRDYLLEQHIPDLIPTLEENAKILRKNAEKIIKISGKKGSESALLEKVALQLEGMAKEPETIAQRLQRYRDNLSALSSLVLTIREQPLDIDYIVISSWDQNDLRVLPNFIEKFIDGIKKFFISFIENYNIIGSFYDKEKSINVWIQMGRDQAETLKILIDTDFTPKTGIGVNLNIIPNENVLLFAVASKENPPDVALNVPRTLAIDYGIRGALLDLSEFLGFDEVKKRFAESALIPYQFRGKVYGLPMTQDFPIMFYRKDILERLNIKIPETWEELYKVIAELQGHNLQFGAGTGNALSFDIFNMLLLQRGGRYYDEDGKRCLLNNDEGVDAFKEWTNLYILYGIPLYYDFFNRFRTGEMPLGIANYTLYNAFKVAAPEISGLWGIAPLPGRKRNNFIDRTMSGNSTAVLIFKNTKKVNESWEFVKWWLSTEIQAIFGRELEALLGAGARYNTSNIEAFSYLPWPSSDYKVLSEQWKYLREIPIVPGSYYISRHLDNAFREVVMLGELQRESLEKYTKEINKEIGRKREEFGLDILR